MSLQQFICAHKHFFFAGVNTHFIMITHHIIRIYYPWCMGKLIYIYICTYIHKYVYIYVIYIWYHNLNRNTNNHKCSHIQLHACLHTRGYRLLCNVFLAVPRPWDQQSKWLGEAMPYPQCHDTSPLCHTGLWGRPCHTHNATRLDSD